MSSKTVVALASGGAAATSRRAGFGAGVSDRRRGAPSRLFACSVSCGSSSTNAVHDRRVVRAPLLLRQQRDGRLGRHRPVIRPIRGHRIEMVDDRQDPRAERNLVAAQTERIAFAVPALVVTQNQRRDRIGERHRADDLGADLRVNADLLELFRRQRSRLGQDVLRNGELADVVQQGGRLHALDLALAHAERARQARRVDLHAADVRMRGLILRVDRQRQRLDRREVQIGHLRHVTPLVVDAAEIHLVGVVGEVERRRQQQRDPDTRMLERPRRAERDSGANEVARCAPQEVLLPAAENRLLGREPDRHRNEQRVADEVGEGCAEQRDARRRPPCCPNAPGWPPSAR